MFVYLAQRGTVLQFPSGHVTLTEPWFLTSEPLLTQPAGVQTFPLSRPAKVDLTASTRSRISLDNMLTDAMGNAIASAFRR